MKSIKWLFEVHHHGMNSFLICAINTFHIGTIVENKYSFHSLHLFRIVGKVHARFRRAVVVENGIAQLVKIPVFAIMFQPIPCCKWAIGPHAVRNNHHFFAVVVHFACECLCNLYHLATAFLFPLGTIIYYHIIMGMSRKSIASMFFQKYSLELSILLVLLTSLQHLEIYILYT